MQPSISFDYNSQGNNGILGIGWSIQGFSMITRCAKTYAQDATVSGINFDQYDNFSLDGERINLMDYNQPYGSDGAQYSTENNSYSRIISYGSPWMR